jgi:hypothetical protein
MRVLSMSFGILALVSVAAGCLAPAGPTDSGGPIGEAASAQVDGGTKTYWLHQLGTLQASAWAGTVGGVATEYWVAKSGYSASAARTFSQTTQSCGTWKRGVCDTSWSGATYYRAVFTETTLDCELPPDPCVPSLNATSFLGSGSYTTAPAAGGPFAWTFSTGTCEYWAMHNTIGSGSNIQSPMTSGYSSLTTFITAMCQANPVPSTWFTVYYEPVANFCSTSVC